jgi:3-dehydroquinate dehydratase
MSKAAKGIVAGFGTDSYRLAILGLANIFGAKAKS